MSDKLGVSGYMGAVDAIEPETPETTSPEGGTAGTSQSSQHDALAKKIIRRNMFLLIMMDVIAMSGGPDIGIALQPLLVYLGASDVVIGFIQGATIASLPGMILIPWITRRFRYKKWFMFSMNTPSIMSLGLMGLGIILSKSLGFSNQTLVLFILVAMSSMYFFAGFGAVPQQEFVASCIPNEYRGRLNGLSSGFGSAGAFGTSALCGWILYHYVKPMSFGYIFLMSYILFQTGYMLSIFAKEKPSVIEKAPRAWSKDMLKAAWNDVPFRRFVAFIVTVGLTVGPAMSFVSIYGYRELGMRMELAAPLTMLTQAMRIPTCPLVGFLADKYGPRKLLKYWPIGVFAAYMTPLLMHNVAGIFISCALWALFGVIYNTLYIVLMYNLPKPEHRAGHFTLIMILQYTIPFIGLPFAGKMCQMFSYRQVFIAGAATALVMSIMIRWFTSSIKEWNPATNNS